MGVFGRLSQIYYYQKLLLSALIIVMRDRIRDKGLYEAMTDLRSLYIGEACWWTIHPTSKQRSEGEKVRIGDDLILVSVSSERYLVSTS